MHPAAVYSTTLQAHACSTVLRSQQHSALQVLLMHGLSTGAKTKQASMMCSAHASVCATFYLYVHAERVCALLQDVLDAMQGLQLMSPTQLIVPDAQQVHLTGEPGDLARRLAGAGHDYFSICMQGLSGQGKRSMQQPQLDVSAADLVLLGWALPSHAQACADALQGQKFLSAPGECMQPQAPQGNLPVFSLGAACQAQQICEQEPAALQHEEAQCEPQPSQAPSAAAAARQATMAGQDNGSKQAAVSPLHVAAPRCPTQPAGGNIPAEQVLGADQHAAALPITAPSVPGAEQLQLGGGWKRKKRRAGKNAAHQPPGVPHPPAAMTQPTAPPAAACLAPALQPYVPSMQGVHAAAGTATGGPAWQAAQAEAAPSWLEGQLRELAQSSRASALPAELAPGALTGRSVAFALLEPFESDGEVVCAGLHIGRCEHSVCAVHHLSLHLYKSSLAVRTCDD